MRPPLRRMVFAILAGLFALVSVAHAGAHLATPSSQPRLVALAGDVFDAGVGCALCQNAAAIQSSDTHLDVSGPPTARVRIPVVVLVAVPKPGGPSSRGPPSLL